MTQPTIPQTYGATTATLPIASPPAAVVGPPPTTVVAANPSLPHHHTKIAPQPSPAETGDDSTDVEHNFEDKKLQKRVANRRSAQLSRKRKKQFIEELKDENDYLRRKEQILRSIPDLVVVFDSSGKLWFVSESVNRFLDFGAADLEGTSFWSLMCTDSVRLLKAAFMDSLAAREGEASTAPLGQGFWDVRLKNKDGTEKPVSLNGVVHFAGDRPECVCSIRPKHEITAKNKTSGANNKINNSNNEAVNSDQGAYANGKAKASSRISDSSENGSSDERCAAA